jgi:cysteine desulfurase
VDGLVNVESLPQEAGLVSVMAANNESGVLQPWTELLEVCRARGIPFHTDATQWVGKLDACGLGQCDYVTGSGHKFGGPKGVGFLVLRDENERLAFLCGGPQEGRRRAGTENYPAVEAMVTAMEWATNLMPAAQVKQAAWRDEFVAQLRQLLPELRVVNEDSPRLWNTVMLVMPRHDNRKWLARLSQMGCPVSTGSACSSGQEGSSVVLQALGAEADELKRTLRVSSGWETSQAEWQALAGAFGEVLASLDGGPVRRGGILD